MTTRYAIFFAHLGRPYEASHQTLRFRHGACKPSNMQEDPNRVVACSRMVGVLMLKAHAYTPALSAMIAGRLDDRTLQEQNK